MAVAAALLTLTSTYAMATPESCNVDLSTVKHGEKLLKTKYDADLKRSLDATKSSYISLLGKCADVAVSEKNYEKAYTYVDQMSQLDPKDKLVQAQRDYVTQSKRLNDLLDKYKQ